MDKYQIAANVELANLDGFKGRLSAAQQKQIFGRNVFGKKQITIDANGQGRVYGSFKVCYGTDSCQFEKSFDEIARIADGLALASF